MRIVLDDLLCPSCLGYVHLFLDACPACGAARAGRIDDAATEGTLGAGDLLGDEATAHAAQMVTRRYALRSSGLESVGDLRSAFQLVARSLTYRATVAADGPLAALPSGSTTLDNATLMLVETTLEVRAGPSGRAIAAIPLDHVLAATPIVKGAPAAEAWAGVLLGGRRLLPQRPVPAGDALVTFSGADGAGQLALANRRGLLAPSARPDHYATLTRWIAILGAAAAEARWLAVGVPAYAAELGLLDPGAVEAARGAASPAHDGVATGGATTPSGVAGRADSAVAAPVSGVRAALEELEDLRAADLVTAEEYEAKRREILARL